TNWIAKGCVQLIEFVWSVMNRTSTPHLDAEWFSGPATSPFQAALRIGGLVLLATFLISIAHAVVKGDVTGVLRRPAADLPATVFVMLSLITLSQAAIGIADSMTDWLWLSTRDSAIDVFDGIGKAAMAIPGGTFLAPFVLIVLMGALAFLWFVLMLRDALI